MNFMKKMLKSVKELKAFISFNKLQFNPVTNHGIRSKVLLYLFHASLDWNRSYTVGMSIKPNT